MKVLVTGGTGIIGTSAVRALLGAGHRVRVLSRHAGRDQQWWPEGVEGWAGDVTNERSIRGSADGCDAIVHVAGIAEEKPPSSTFQSVNIDGTRYAVLEAERAGVAKFLFVSSLGAERGTSAYHKSKCVAESVVQTFTRDWVIVRPGAVYGPGDGHMSVLLQMVRTLPVIPTIGAGDQRFQPIWHEDLAAALMAAVERADIGRRVLDVAGEPTSQNDLVARMAQITGRSPLQAPLPEVIAGWGLRALDLAGVSVGFTEDQLAMLVDGNVIPADRRNGLTDVLGIAATPLDVGLRRLANEQPAQLPSDGVGTLTRKRFWVDIRGGAYDADGLFAYVRRHLAELMPAPLRMRAPADGARLEEGDTLTIEIPVRGHIQVRVGEVMDRRITLLTLAGHPIAGAVRFLVEPQAPQGADGSVVRFEIQVYDRPASAIDEILMRTVGDLLQRASWIGLARNVAQAAGGTASDVQIREEELDDDELATVDKWARALSDQLSRKSASGARS